MKIVNREQLIKGMEQNTLFLDEVDNAFCTGNPCEINEILTKMGEKEIEAKYKVGEHHLYRAWPFVLEEGHGKKFNFLAWDLGNTHFSFVCEFTHEAVMEVIHTANASSVSEMLREQRAMLEVFKEVDTMDQVNVIAFENVITEIQNHVPVLKQHCMVTDFNKLTSYQVLKKLMNYEELIKLSEHLTINQELLQDYQNTLADFVKYFEYLNELSRSNAVHASLTE